MPTEGLPWADPEKKTAWWVDCGPHGLHGPYTQADANKYAVGVGEVVFGNLNQLTIGVDWVASPPEVSAMMAGAFQTHQRAIYKRKARDDPIHHATHSSKTKIFRHN